MVEKNDISTTMSNKLDKASNNLDSINLSTNMELIKEWAAYILDSEFKPKSLKTTQDIANAVLLGRELGFTPLVSMNNIYPIEGKPTIGINLYIALALKNHTTFEIIKDFEAEYKYYDDKGNYYLEEYLAENKETFVSVPFQHDKIPTGYKPQDGKVIIFRTTKPSDYVTEIHFSRKFSDGKIVKLKHTFKFSEATQMGLVTKSNWMKMPKIMLRARCLSSGIRLIGGDYINGVYETSEIADAHNIDIKDAQIVET